MFLQFLLHYYYHHHYHYQKDLENFKKIETGKNNNVFLYAKMNFMVLELGINLKMAFQFMVDLHIKEIYLELKILQIMEVKLD